MPMSIEESVRRAVEIRAQAVGLSSESAKKGWDTRRRNGKGGKAKRAPQVKNPGESGPGTDTWDPDAPKPVNRSLAPPPKTSRPQGKQTPRKRSSGAPKMVNPSGLAADEIAEFIGNENSGPPCDADCQARKAAKEERRRARAARKAAGGGTTGGTGTADDPIRTDDVDAASDAILAGKHVQLNRPDEVGTLLDKLAGIARDAKAKGEKAPNYNLCLVSVPKTNLFCGENIGRPRVKMPQLSKDAKDVPKTGPDGKPTKAGQMEPDEYGSINLGPSFVEHMKAQGVAVSDGRMLASHMKASQNELDGTKVAKLTQKIESGERTPETEGATFVTSDGYIIDGHHRWAAGVGAKFDPASPTFGKDLNLPVTVLDIDIVSALDMAYEYSTDMGIPPASAETVVGSAAMKSRKAAAMSVFAAGERQERLDAARAVFAEAERRARVDAARAVFGGPGSGATPGNKNPWYDRGSKKGRSPGVDISSGGKPKKPGLENTPKMGGPRKGVIVPRGEGEPIDPVEIPPGGTDPLLGHENYPDPNQKQMDDTPPGSDPAVVALQHELEAAAPDPAPVRVVERGVRGEGEIVHDEASAVYNYTADAVAINEALRLSRPPGMEGGDKEVGGGIGHEAQDMTQVVRDTDAYLSRSAIPRDITVYRGMDLDPDVADSLVPGFTFQNPGFTSTTITPPGTSTGWLSPADKGNVRLEISAPAGTPGAYVGALSKWGNAEREVLLPRELNLKVDSREEVDGVDVVRASVIPTVHRVMQPTGPRGRLDGVDEDLNPAGPDEVDVPDRFYPQGASVESPPFL